MLGELMSEVKKDDAIFVQKFHEATKELKDCQEDKNTNSCLKCEKLLGCDTRKAYVDAVYGSMSKGQAGGFEF